MKRRNFLRRCGLAAAAGWYPLISRATGASCSEQSLGNEIQADVCIVGGGLGGCAAALAATRAGLRVVMSEPTDWIGGQLTQQVVPPDEHHWIESFGCTRAYRNLRSGIRDHYHKHYPLTPKAASAKYLNPGNGWVSRICHEPKVSLAVLDAMLAGPVQEGRLTILLNTEPIRADVEGDRVRAVKLLERNENRATTVSAKYFVDASETGELLPLTGTEYVTGSESAKETGEPRAPEVARPANLQGFTWCFVLDYRQGEDHTIDKPEDYAFWENYTHPSASGDTKRLFSFPRPVDGSVQKGENWFLPPDSSAGGAIPRQGANFWTYRRLIDVANFVPPRFESDISVINWPHNDYVAGNMYEVTPEEREKHLRGMRQQSLSLLYWLQTAAPRPDGGAGWKGLRLRGDVTGTPDGFAKHPYVRESRRIKAEFTVLEQHITPEKPRKIGETAVAEQFADSVGVGHYWLDLHRTTGGDEGVFTACCPFQIPLGALLPRRVENLIPGCKNIGTTHISNGAYREHPTEWNIGEAAGELAAFALRRNTSPRGVRNQQKLLAEFQDRLVRHGFELDWSKLAATHEV